MHLLPFSLAVTCLLSLAPDAIAVPHPYVVSTPSKSITLSRKAPQRRSPSDSDLGASLRRRKLALEAKYGIGHAKNQKRASGMNLITNEDADSTFFGSLAVGTPPVSFDVILDTGSSDLWLASQSANGAASNIPAGITTFDPSSSSSFKNLNKTFEITYDSGEAEGTLGQDTVQMAGFKVAAQTFATVDQVSTGVLNSPLSGLMGLAWQQIASSGATPFWEALAESNDTLTDPLFSFQLTRYNNDTKVQDLEPGGTFTLGATNASLFTGEIDYQDIPSGQIGYWLQELSAMTVQGNSVTLESGSSSYAAIDTGTTLVGGPANVISEIYAQIPGSQAGSGNLEGYYTYPCSTQVEVTLKFGSSSIAWPISPADFEFTTAPNDDSTCVGAFFEVDNSGTTAPPWIVGDTFLKNVYSVFRYNPASVGFAQLSPTALAMNGKVAAPPSPTIGSAAAAVSATNVDTGTSPLSNGAASVIPGASLTLLSMAAAVIAGALLF